jgi:hypothetical protein
MFTFEIFCATLLLLILSVYTCCYAKGVARMRQQDIEFEALLRQIGEEKEEKRGREKRDEKYEEV